MKNFKLKKKLKKGNSVKVLMNTFKCGKMQIYNIIKNKININEQWLIGKFI